MESREGGIRKADKRMKQKEAERNSKQRVKPLR